MFCMHVWSAAAGLSTAAPDFSDFFCCKQGQGIYPSHRPFLSHWLRETRSAIPIWPLKQNCPSFRPSRIIGQRFFKVFPDTIRKEFVYPSAKIRGETRISKHLKWSQQPHAKECCQRALAQPDLMQLWMKEDLPLDYIVLGFTAAEQNGLRGVFTDQTPRS